MASLRRTPGSINDAQMTKFLWTILKQLDHKSVSDTQESRFFHFVVNLYNLNLEILKFGNTSSLQITPSMHDDLC
jgi:hypothetical protein